MRTFLLIISITSILSAEVLKISFSRSKEEPYVFIDKRELTGGVLKEIMDALSVQSGIKMEYVLVPRRNQEMEMKTGNIDGMCLINSDEIVNSSEYLWSNSLYEEEDVLIVRKSDAQSLQNIDSLLGRKLGTLQGHSYPGLKPYFENKSIERVENKKLINNMNQLRFGVIDAAIGTKLAVGHCIKKQKMENMLIVSKNIIDKQDLHCAFRKEKSASLKKINSTLVKLKEQGVIDKIIRKYRASL